MSDLEESHVVTCFLRSEGEVLLLLRSEDVGSYAGAWGAVTGYAEGDPDAAAWKEIREETGFSDAALVRRGDPFPVVDAALGKCWVVHPFLFDVPRRAPKLNYESTTSEWVSPVEITRRTVVPRLWESYRAVSPTPDDVRGDREHGSTYLSLRALEVLRDLAAENPSRDALGDVAGKLIAGRPSMAAVRNRVNRAMHRSRECAPSERADAVHEVVRAAVESDRAAAEEAALLLHDATVLTLSRSGTVIAALLGARPRVLVAASHPGGEGVDVAGRLARAGVDVTLIADAAMASAPAFDLVLLGCDTVLPDGTLFNKVGSRLAALVARDRSVPVYAATSVDKVLASGRPAIESADRSRIGDVPDVVHVHTDVFESVPADLIDAYATEAGLQPPAEMSDHAASFRALEQW